MGHSTDSGVLVCLAVVEAVSKPGCCHENRLISCCCSSRQRFLIPLLKRQFASEFPPRKGLCSNQIARQTASRERRNPLFYQGIMEFESLSVRPSTVGTGCERPVARL
jgi:hypothetical protein